jgi:hypothetical protein
MKTSGATKTIPILCLRKQGIHKLISLRLNLLGTLHDQRLLRSLVRDLERPAVPLVSYSINAIQ